jgi:hypothetical protein
VIASVKFADNEIDAGAVPLSDNISTLKRETQELARLFEKRIDQLRNRPDLLRTIRTLSGANLSPENVRSLLPSSGVAVGLDGSMDYDEVLEMLLFYVTSTGYVCNFARNAGIPEFDLRNAKRNEELAVSAVVPLWREDLLNVAETNRPLDTELDFRVNLERIPFALMTMSELYLALRVIRSGKVNILFLDRPFSATYPSLHRDLGLTLMRPTPSLEGFKTSKGLVSKQDLLLASNIGPGSFYVPRRRGFLHYAVTQLLLDGQMKKADIAAKLGVSDNELTNALNRLRSLSKRFGSTLLSEDGVGSLSLQDAAKGFWPRVEEMTLALAERIFNPTSDVPHSLILPSGNWLSVIDLNSLNLFLLQLVMSESQKQKILVIGVAKDTTSTDFTRSALPLALVGSQSSANVPGLKSDKALLTIISTVNAAKVNTPWRTVSYDAAHTTMIMEKEKVQLRAARQLISRERFFVRQYFQLRSFMRDPEIRSPVFLFDRPFNPNFDEPLVSEVEAVERGEPTTLSLFMEAEGKRSMLDDLCLLVLSKCDNEEVLEAYGHNQLLYLADKFVKHEVAMTKGLLRGVVDLELTPLARKQKVFSIARRFRDLRAESESARRMAATAHGELAR